MQQTTPFYMGGSAETSFLDHYQTFFARELSDGCLFAEKHHTSVRVYRLRCSLYLLNNEEFETRCGVAHINASSLNSVSEEKLDTLQFSQAVFREDASMDEYYSDRKAFDNNLTMYAADYCKNLGMTPTTSRYFMWLAGSTLTGMGLYRPAFTNQGVKFTHEKFMVSEKTFLKQLDSLTKNGVIRYEKLDKGEVVLKMSKKALNYNPAIAPKFFEALTF